MKLLTLNTHSWMEPNSKQKMTYLAQHIAAEQYDVIAFQEVNQSRFAPKAHVKDDPYYFPAKKRPAIHKNNFAFVLQQTLLKMGTSYYWTWFPCHLGYRLYDEGVAIFSLHPIEEIHGYVISSKTHYFSQKRRGVAGIEITNNNERMLFYSCHLSGWQDKKKNSFMQEWLRLESTLTTLHPDQKIVLLGDFNASANRRGKGYDWITNVSGWHDTYALAPVPKGKFTFPSYQTGSIHPKQHPRRIDYILCNYKPIVLFAEIIFDGKDTPLISDHCGLKVYLDTAALSRF